MLSADYRQMELRMMAHASGDSVLCQLLQVHGSVMHWCVGVVSAWRTLVRRQRPQYGCVTSVTDRDKAILWPFSVIR